MGFYLLPDIRIIHSDCGSVFNAKFDQHLLDNNIVNSKAKAKSNQNQVIELTDPLNI